MKCLAKDPARRWQTATDLADELRWLATAREESAPAGAPGRMMRLASLTLAAFVGLGAAEVWLSWPGAPAARDFRSRVHNPGAARGIADALRTSEPGLLSRRAAGRLRRGERDGTDSLFLRALNELEARELPGTINASYPFWSPDGRRIAFSQDGNLKRIIVGDGSIEVIATLASGPGTWGTKGVILVAQGGRLRRIGVSDGSVADIGPPLTASSQADAPRVPAGRRRFLYCQRIEPRPGIYAGSLSNTTLTFVTAADSGAFESQGQLFLVMGSEVRRIAFDAKSASVSGEAVTLQRFGRITASVSAFSVADNGAVAAILGNPYGTRLAWFELKGERAGTVAESEGYRNPVISPDGCTWQLSGWILEAAGMTCGWST